MEEGKRFSLVYLDRSSPLKDSKRFRNRIAAYYLENLDDRYNIQIKKIIERETGAEVHLSGYGYDLESFFKKNAGFGNYSPDRV